MSDLFEALGEIEYAKRRPPGCCYECRHLDNEWDEYQGRTYWFCSLNIFFPRKKNSCKRQERRDAVLPRRS